MKNRQTRLFEELAPEPPCTNEKSLEFAARVQAIEKELEGKLGSHADSKAFVVAAVKLAAGVFVNKMHEDDEKMDPRWFLGVCNAVLTIVAHEKGIKVKFPMDALMLPDEAKEMLVASKLATPEEVGLCRKDLS